MLRKFLLIVGLALSLEMIEKEKVAVGIDLGTTFSSVCVYSKVNNETKFIRFADKLSFPSVAYCMKGLPDEEGKKLYGGFYLGWDAYGKNSNESSPGRYFYGFKRVVGLANAQEATNNVDQLTNNVTYTVVKDNINDKEAVAFHVLDANKKVIAKTNAEILSTLLLKFMKDKIDEFYEIERCVITIPAYFHPVQETSTEEAALAAGFESEKLSIHKEPVAAAYAYQFNKLKSNERLQKSEDTLVFDLGGGTLDCSVVELEKTNMIVVKHGGDLYLGGENANDLLTNYWANQILNYKNVNIMDHPNRKLKLRKFVEEFKIALCNKVNQSQDKASVSHSDVFLYDNEDKGIPLSLDLKEFNGILQPFFDRIKDVLVGRNHGMFRDVQGEGSDEPLLKSKIKRILLVGGSTRLPEIEVILREIFGNTIPIYRDADADTIVAEGACLISASEANMLSENTDLQMVDVVPVDIGICTDEDFFEPILQKDALIPGSGTKTFTTSYDNQTKVRIRVAQGCRPSFNANIFIGEFELQIPPGQRRGVPQIAVSVSRPLHGAIEVTAKDVATNEERKVVFEPKKGKLSVEQIRALIKDADENANIDREYRQRYESLKKLENAIFEVKLEFSSPGVSEDDKINVESLCTATQKWLENNKSTATVNDFNEKHDSFMQSIQGFRSKKDTESAKPEEKKEKAREAL